MLMLLRVYWSVLCLQFVLFSPSGQKKTINAALKISHNTMKGAKLYYLSSSSNKKGQTDLCVCVCVCCVCVWCCVPGWPVLWSGRWPQLWSPGWPAAAGARAAGGRRPKSSLILWERRPAAPDPDRETRRMEILIKPPPAHRLPKHWMCARLHSRASWAVSPASALASGSSGLRLWGSEGHAGWGDTRTAAPQTCTRGRARRSRAR